ncbi:proline-rich transmembrane protein 3-like [Embiotoca jacksoni]|uniref:proline-rich transmembrane protein 3-like n=1 Tax=Embiotoca jacksoni TaxID=100190 RepID=UPI0037043972
MGRSSLLFITLTVTLSSVGSLIQTSHSLDASGSVQVTRSTDINSRALDSLASEVIFNSESSVEGNGHHDGSAASQQISHTTVLPTEPDRVSNKKHSGSEITLTTRLALTPHPPGTHDQGAEKADTSITGHTHSSAEGSLLEGSQITTEAQLKESHTSRVNDDFLTSGDRHQLPVQTSVVTITNYTVSGPGGPCVVGVQPCVVPKIFNGTSLLWDDMSRTLAFAWELHVYGSASLFTLMTVMALLGMAGACTLSHPLCDALRLANSFLVMGGSLRTVLLVLDPYGTRQILSHATLAALHNIPLQLLLWAQVVLALVTLRGLKLLLIPLKLQRPWVVGGLATSHCAALLVAELYSSTFSSALPLLLHTFSFCWGFPFCLGILAKSLSHLNPFTRSPVAQWVPSKRTERREKRVTAVCAFLGVLCCSLHMYSLFWLYGLLGNWRRFGWVWWLSQFWARILELAWGFSLLVLGSWIFWRPYSHSNGDHGQGRGEVSKRFEKKSWADLIPSNWAKYNLSKAGISNNAMCPYDDHPSTMIPEYKPDPICNSSLDSQAAFLWQKVGERECMLSLIEFDMRPPSPIDLRRSIDNALHHGQLVSGGLFTPPPPSWTQMMGTDIIDGDNGPTALTPPYVGYRWMLDTESISASLDHFQAREPVLSPTATADYNGSVGSPATAHQGEEFSTVMHLLDDDVTDL